MTWRTPRSTILQNVIALCQPTPEISVTKILRTNKKKQKNKQTVNDISTTCLSACVDNKYASCPDWRVSPHADRRHRKLFTTLAVAEQAASVFHRDATVGQVCRTRLTTERVIDFSIFDLGGLTTRPKVTKRGDDLLST